MAQAWKPRLREMKASAQGHILARGRCQYLCPGWCGSNLKAERPRPHQASGGWRARGPALPVYLAWTSVPGGSNLTVF